MKYIIYIYIYIYIYILYDIKYITYLEWNVNLDNNLEHNKN